VRIVIADDEGLLRAGLARLLADAGFDVVGLRGDAETVLSMVAACCPDIAIVDIRMPPGDGAQGLAAAQEIRRRHPRVGVLVLSHLLEPRYAMRLLEDAPERAGYLLKERVSDLETLTDALRRIDDGECVIDSTIVSRLLARRHGPLCELTEREREVLALIAEGRSNASIGQTLFLSPKTVETHISHIFTKLGLRESAEHHPRVLAVLAYLRASPDRGQP
jgi:DNA-binding NarL/FixJ family response regulator